MTGKAVSVPYSSNKGIADHTSASWSGRTDKRQDLVFDAAYRDDLQGQQRSASSWPRGKGMFIRITEGSVAQRLYGVVDGYGGRGRKKDVGRPLGVSGPPESGYVHLS